MIFLRLHFFLAGCLLWLIVPVATAQALLKKNVSVVAEQQELNKVIETLQQQSGISFFYSTTAIAASRKITCRYFNVPLKKFLDEVILPLQIQYKVFENQVILYAANLPAVGKTEAPPVTTVAGKPAGIVPVKADFLVLKGKVVTDKGMPLAGASVVIADSKAGTVSAKDGTFAVETEKKTGQVQISYITYQPAVVAFDLTDTKPLSITLIPLVKTMDEVVVIGYGTQAKSEMTSASVTVKSTDLADAPVTTIDAALQGRATGAFVSQQAGTPGAPVRIQVRGTGSISSATEPLYIIDGQYVFQELTGVGEGITGNNINPLATLNPDDVATIEILKDAAATAIYGSRGANGVVLITTKQGKRGQGNFTVALNRGTTVATRVLDYVTGSQWLSLIDEARRNSVGFGIVPGQEQFNPLLLVANDLPVPSGITGNRYGPLTSFTRSLAEQTNTNWTDKLLQNGQITEVRMSASNGFEKGNFYLSGQYWKETGTIKNQTLQRASVRSNLNYQPFSTVRISSRMNYVVLQSGFIQTTAGDAGEAIGRGNRGATGGWAQANLRALPIMPVYDSAGSYFDPLRGRNIAAGNDPQNFNSGQQQYRFLGSLSVEYTPFAALSVKGEAGADFVNARNNYWVSDVIRYNRYASESNSAIRNLTGTAYATWKPTLTKGHRLTAVAGAEWQKTNHRRLTYAFEGVEGSQQEMGEIALGEQVLLAVGGIFPDQGFVSFFMRNHYDFGKKYFVSASIRRDGSSVFAPGNRFGTFPSVSAGWVLSEAPFLANSFISRSFSFLKFRASYGQTGNAGIPAFGFVSNFVNWPIYGQSPALALSVLGNPQIRWEKNNQLDAGFDWTLRSGRLKGVIDVFARTTRDMLLSVPVAPTVGIGAGSQSVVINIGDLRNKGVEMELNWVVKDNYKIPKRLKWTLDANLTLVNNKVLWLTNALNTQPTGEFPVANGIQQGITITQTGEALANYYLATYAGLDSEGFETIYEVDPDILRKTGRTVHTGRVLRATIANVTNNRTIQYGKSGLPTWYGGITNSLKWRIWEVRMHFTFQGGNYLYDAHEEQTSYVRTGTNVLRSSVIGNTWTPDNPAASLPRLTWNMRDNFVNAQGEASPQNLSTRTTRFLYRGDYARLKTLSVACQMPTQLAKLLRIQSARVMLSAQNLLTFTAYPGFDPEILNTGPGTQGRNLSQGFIGQAPLPQVRTFMAGVQVVF
jgi:TonB-linked SusC/RagA family outer membrane protein